MSKIIVKTVLKNKTKNEIYQGKYLGIKLDDRIIYNEDNISNTLVLSKQNIMMKRRCDNYTIFLPFSLKGSKEGKYIVNNLGEIPFKIQTEKLILENNKIYIKYFLDLEEKNEFEYVLELEELL